MPAGDTGADPDAASLGGAPGAVPGGVPGHGRPLRDAATSAGHALLGVGYAQPAASRPVVRLGERQGAGVEVDHAEIAEEVPIALVYNGRSHAVMMGTPADLEDFAVGFTISEAIVGASRIGAVQVVRASHGIEVQVEIPVDDASRLATRGRAIAGRTGCGLCGVEAIEDALRVPAPVHAALRLPQNALWRAGEELAVRQELNARTRSAHAAAWADASGALHVVREDVGRHNAVDKVLGALARSGTAAQEGFLVVTSRASYELVQKAAVAGVPLLAAISRPTGLAIRLAESTGITLVGLLRGRSASVYAHAGRITAAC